MSDKDIAEAFAKGILRLCELHAWSEREVCRKTACVDKQGRGVTLSSLRRLRTGANVSLRTAGLLAKAFGVTVDRVVELGEKEEL